MVVHSSEKIIGRDGLLVSSDGDVLAKRCWNAPYLVWLAVASMLQLLYYGTITKHVNSLQACLYSCTMFS